MYKIDEKSKIEMVLNFKWSSQFAQHEEIHFCNVNVWRDIDLFPIKIKDNILGKEEGDVFSVAFKKGELFKYSDDNVLDLEIKQFQPPHPYRSSIKPKLGRFYPLGFFIGLREVFPQNIRPARVIEITNGRIKIDINVPISFYDIEVEGHILKVRKKTSEVGGECREWLAISLENGPGMQIRYKNIPTDFEFENPETYLREDESDDTIFYKQPRLTTHIDAKCHENLMMLYEKLLPKEGKILDLMSGYQSHIPENNNSFVVGLGLNEEEMRLNPRLNDFILKDINKDPRLPFNDEEFDAVVCDLSIEYVIKPFDLIREVKRILKKDGVFTVSFSNRYFPSKVIKLWTNLHDFERMGYVLEILLRVQGFKDIKTFSVRGFRRPLDDKYFGCTFFSDPLYLVYAKKEILINNS